MSQYRFSNSPAPVRKVTCVQFGPINPDELRKYSVVQVRTDQIWEKGNPVEGGLSDPRMGTVDRDRRCTTDSANDTDCPGYFGHLELAKPMYHCGFIKAVVAVLRCIAYDTSAILLEPTSDKYKAGLRIRNPESRLKYFTKCCSGMRTNPATGAPQPVYRLEGTKITAEFPLQKDAENMQAYAEGRQDLSAEKAYEILKKMTDEDITALGFNPKYARPEWFIITVLPISPPPVRPDVMMDSSSRSQDDITHKLSEIIRSNAELRRQEQNGAPQHIVQEIGQLLQFHITTMMNNTIPGMPVSSQRSGRPIKSISQRLKGKEGRIRGNLMGKRVDFSARTVIGGDANIELDELGVPWSIALNLTYPETVTPYNRDKLQRLVDNGPHPPPGETGAKYIIRDDGTRRDLEWLTNQADRVLQIGYTVERHLQNGDLVLFNRQPSLHKMSMMCHKVRILPYSTFRLNLSVTSPYNADFDGDEMNMHVPQAPETRAELSEIMAVARNIVSPQSNKPVMGIVQDTLLGCRLMTKRDTFISKEDFMNIVMWLDEWDGVVPAPAILKPKPLWTGKQVFNLFLPNVNLKKKASWDNDPEGESEDISTGDTKVLIQSGQVIYGTLCKKTLGAGAGSLVHVTWLEHGPAACCRMLGLIQKTVNYWLLQHGFSMGIGDTVADDRTMAVINDTISRAKEEVKILINKFQSDQLEPQPGCTMMESFENQVNQVLNKARDDAGKTAQKTLTEDNNVKRMVTAGSKGSFINISQMIACVGQQNVEGKRIPYGFARRSLPHFTADDYGPESRGFVENSYLRGLTPQEFFFHAMGGREGLIDTAVKTASTGYIQRRLVKAMEDVMIKYDGTVRNSCGDVIQFLYGEDGMDGQGIEDQKLPALKLNEKELQDKFGYDLDAPRWTPDWLEQETLNHLRTNMDARKLIDMEWDNLREDLKTMRTEIIPNGEANVFLPVNLTRLIWNAQMMFGIWKNRSQISGLDPLYVIDRVRELTQKLVVVSGEHPLSVEAQNNATLLFFHMLRSTLHSKRVLREFKLTQEAFDWILGEVETKFMQTMAYPGEMIGTLAAQSIGQPATQMTLNTFHFAGVSGKNVTLGVPRLTEIINVAKNIKTPSLTVHLARDTGDNIHAKSVQTALEYTTLAKVTASTEIYYDPEPTDTVIDEDREFVQSYFEMPDEELDTTRMSPWLLRIELDRDMMVDKKLAMADVAEKINSEFEDDLTCIFNDDNAEKLILRIRVMDSGGEKGDEDTNAEDEDVFLRQIEANMLTQLQLKGIKGITKVFIRGTDHIVGSEAGYKKIEEWVLDTEGVNLQGVLSHPEVDYTRTVSNHMVEIIDVLGIEATRNQLIREMRRVIEFDGSYVNYRHLAILCDIMTYRGHLMAITRHGINRNDTGPLMRCSFEESVDILFRSPPAQLTPLPASLLPSFPALSPTAALLFGFVGSLAVLRFSSLGKAGRVIREQVKAELGDAYQGRHLWRDGLGGWCQREHHARPACTCRDWVIQPPPGRGHAPGCDRGSVWGGVRHGLHRCHDPGTNDPGAWAKHDPKPHGLIQQHDVSLSNVSIPRRKQCLLSNDWTGRRVLSDDWSRRLIPRLFTNKSIVQPDVTGVQPHVTGIQPDVTGVQPDLTGVQPDLTGIQPDITGLQPDVSRLQPDVSRIQPNVSGLQPHVASLQPDLAGLQPDLAGLQPDLAGVQPGVQPNVADLQPDVAGIQPNVTGLQPEQSC